MLSTYLFRRVGAALIALTITLSVTGQTVLDQYIRQGLESNLVIQQKRISLKQAEHSLQIARTWFLPSVSLLGDYTSGKGGRNISIPIGDLLNPVYTTLNQLTESDAFPHVENVSQDFFPYNFMDTRLRTSLPLLNTDLHINRSIEKQKVRIEEFELKAYQRRLVYEIKTSYYDYLSLDAAVRIYRSALGLVERNVAVNESLLRNGTNLHSNVLRAKSELEKVRAELNEAEMLIMNARKYFNFLLNRPLDTDIIETDEAFDRPVLEHFESALHKKEELAVVQMRRELLVSALQMHRYSRLPRINAFLDVGAQASNWNFNRDAKYYLAGVQLSIPVFQGFRNSLQIRKSKMQLQSADLEIRNVSMQLQMMSEVASNQLAVAARNLEAAHEELRSARSYFNLIEKGFKEGIHSQIEYVDARAQFTQAEIKLSLRQFEMLKAAALLERETSSYNF